MGYGAGKFIQKSRRSSMAFFAFAQRLPKLATHLAGGPSEKPSTSVALVSH
jgi:hypothetical protein